MKSHELCSVSRSYYHNGTSNIVKFSLQWCWNTWVLWPPIQLSSDVFNHHHLQVPRPAWQRTGSHQQEMKRTAGAAKKPLFAEQASISDTWCPDCWLVGMCPGYDFGRDYRLFGVGPLLTLSMDTAPCHFQAHYHQWIFIFLAPGPLPLRPCLSCGLISKAVCPSVLKKGPQVWYTCQH